MTTYSDGILTAGSDPWGFGQIEEHVSWLVERVDLKHKVNAVNAAREHAVGSPA